MKSAKFSFDQIGFFENPRSVDRLIAVCSVLLVLCLLMAGYLALQPTMNPKTFSNIPVVQSVQQDNRAEQASTGGKAEGSQS